jgi:hypothetical protein
MKHNYSQVLPFSLAEKLKHAIFSCMSVKDACKYSLLRYRALAGAVMALLVIVLWAGNSQALYYPTVQEFSLTRPSLLEANFLPGDNFERPRPLGLKARYQLTGNFDYYLWRLIQDENWEEWLLFQRDPRRVLPAVAIFNLLKLVKMSQLGKKPLFPMPKDDLPKIDWLKFQLVQMEEIPAQLGELGLDYRVHRKKKEDFSPIDWFQEQVVAIATRPWSWENFLPRIFFIGGVIATMLLVVEGLRFVFGLGRRRRKSGRASA